MRYILLSIALILTCTPQIFSQRASHTYLDASLHYGFVIVHSKELRPVKNSNPFGIDIGIGKQLFSQNAYDACKCAPKLGFNLQLWDYDNPEVLGRGAFFNFLVETQFRNGAKKIFPSAFFGTGIVYGSKPYDAETNPNNLSYSTEFSFSLLLGAAVNYRLDKSTSAFIRANYNHSSNGGRKQPNKGINFPTASAGLSFYPGTLSEELNFDVNNKIIPESKNKYELRTFVSSENVSSVGDAQYFIGGFEALYSRWVGGVHTLTGSVEMIWDHARKKSMELSGLEDEAFYTAGVLLGHEFQLGKFVFRQSLGAYLYDEYDVNDALYQRYSLAYNAFGPVHISFGLKAHRHVADFLDIGVAIRQK